MIIIPTPSTRHTHTDIQTQTERDIQTERERHTDIHTIRTDGRA